MAEMGIEALQRPRFLAAGHCADIGNHTITSCCSSSSSSGHRSQYSHYFTREVATAVPLAAAPRHGGRCTLAKNSVCPSAGTRSLFSFSSCWADPLHTAKASRACSDSIGWAGLDISVPPSSSAKAAPRFRAEFAGQWSWLSSGYACIGRGQQNSGELLLNAVPARRRGKSVSWALPTAPRISWVQHRRATADRFLRRMLKFSVSVVLSRLRRSHRFTESISAAELWLLHRRRAEPLLGAVRAASQSYDSCAGVSSQAAGNESLEPAALLDRHQPGRLFSERARETFLATGFGWRVRDAVGGEMPELMRLADIQTGAFHERSAIFDELFYKLFHAEVLSTLQYKTRQLPPDRYACLLAEMDPSQTEFSDEEGESQRSALEMIVGTVDITVLSDKDILRHLPGAEDYLYLSGMAVDSNYRRRSVATLLLEACLARALEWNFNYLVLHAYENDERARNLYARAGFDIVAADPAWMTQFFGRRRRVVMAKKIPLSAAA